MTEYIPLLTRILASVAAGFLLGFERQYHRQPAGLKTHILICTGSTLLMIVSLLLAGGLSILNGTAKQLSDPGRVAAQVVSGIGFLGGGAIIRQGFNIKGLTTAATIWVAAAIGLAIGMGAYFAAGVTLASILLVLVLMEKFEARFFPSKSIKPLYLVFREKYFNYDALVHELHELKIVVGNMDVSRTMDSDRIRLSLQVHIPHQVNIEQLTDTLQRIGTLVKLELTTNDKPTR